MSDVKAPDLTPPTAPAPKASKKKSAAPADGSAPAPKEPKISRFKTLYPDDMPVTVLVEGNPKRGKSKERFEGYKNAKTVGEAVAAGVTRADIAWDVGHGLIKVG